MRTLRVALAQLNTTVGDLEGNAERILAAARQAAAAGADLVAFPELALTTFFPRWWYENQAEVDARFFEAAMPTPATQPLFDEGKRLGVEITFYSFWYEFRYGITACLMLTVALMNIGR